MASSPVSTEPCGAACSAEVGRRLPAEDADDATGIQFEPFEGPVVSHCLYDSGVFSTLPRLEHSLFFCL